VSKLNLVFAVITVEHIFISYIFITIQTCSTPSAPLAT